MCVLFNEQCQCSLSTGAAQRKTSCFIYLTRRSEVMKSVSMYTLQGFMSIQTASRAVQDEIHCLHKARNEAFCWSIKCILSLMMK